MKPAVIDRIDTLLLALWIGIATGIGYIAAPVLFATLDDRKLAGMLAGKMFYVVSLIGLCVGLYLLIRTLVREGAEFAKAWRFWVLLVANVPSWLSLFYIQPRMQALKAEGLQQSAELAKSFAMLHGISSILYLLGTICGLLLLFFGLRSANPKPRSAIGEL